MAVYKRDKEDGAKITVEYTQADINLAINYTVIEQVLKAMGIYRNICDEHEFLPFVFLHAKQGTLENYLKSCIEEYTENYRKKHEDEIQLRGIKGEKTTKSNEDISLEFLTEFMEKLRDIFNIDDKVLSGQRQIELMIDADLNNTILYQFAHAQINDYQGNGLIDLVEKYNKARFDTCEEYPWDEAYEGEVSDDTLKYQLGEFKIEDGTSGITFKEFRHILSYAVHNPIGICNAGIYEYYLLQSRGNTKLGIEPAKKDADRIARELQNIRSKDIKTLTDAVDDKDEHRKTKDKYRRWRELIRQEFGYERKIDEEDILEYVEQAFLSDDQDDVSLENLLWETVFRNIKYEAVWSNKKEYEEQQYMVKWRQHPYDLENIIRCIVSKKHAMVVGTKTKEAGKAATLKKISNLAPYPLVISKASDLLQLINSLNDLGYRYNNALLDEVCYSSIDTEIKRYESKARTLRRLISAHEGLTGDFDIISTYTGYLDGQQTEPEDTDEDEIRDFEDTLGKIEENYNYRVQRLNEIENSVLPELRKMKADFETDPASWYKQYIDTCEKVIEDCSNRLEQLRDKLGKTNADKRELYRLADMHRNLVLGLKGVKSKSAVKDGKPKYQFIIVKEPYLEEVGLMEIMDENGKMVKVGDKRKQNGRKKTGDK